MLVGFLREIGRKHLCQDIAVTRREMKMKCDKEEQRIAADEL